VSRKLIWMVVLAAVLAAPAGAGAQELYHFPASALGGFGGSLDADRGDGLGNPSFQLGLSMVTEARTHVGLRIGQIGFDEPLESIDDADLTYLTLGGEYRFDRSYYQSGVYLGLGGYRLEGTRPDGSDADDTVLGMVLGLTGEFEINPNFGVLVEFSGHWADLEDTKAFAQGLGGIAFHF
jgi:hypothetical protein